MSSGRARTYTRCVLINVGRNGKKSMRPNWQNLDIFCSTSVTIMNWLTTGIMHGMVSRLEGRTACCLQNNARNAVKHSYQNTTTGSFAPLNAVPNTGTDTDTKKKQIAAWKLASAATCNGMRWTVYIVLKNSFRHDTLVFDLAVRLGCHVCPLHYILFCDFAPACEDSNTSHHFNALIKSWPDWFDNNPYILSRSRADS